MVTRLTAAGFHEAEISTDEWSIRLAMEAGSRATARPGSDADFRGSSPANEPERGGPEDVSGIEEPSAPPLRGETTSLQEARKVIPITSHLVGLFWSSPSKNGSAKVTPGDTVEKGQVIGGIEAVTLMNPIQAPGDGRILEVLVDDGDPVEYGQFLFLLETAPQGEASSD